VPTHQGLKASLLERKIT